MHSTQPAPPALIPVAIAVTTRDRPQMLAACLDSFRAMSIPETLSVQFLIVENNPTLTMAGSVEALRASLAAPHGLCLLHEPELGIPFARNAALDAALAQGCRWLIFVDDDETVDPDWLSHLIEGAETQGFDLAAGPVEAQPPEGALTPTETALYAHYVAEAQSRRQSGAKWLASGLAGRHDLATNNWIGRLSALQAAGLRFDEAMRHTGGTDTDLSRRAAQAGLRLGWIPEAVVYEVVPRNRLTLSYVFGRSRSQTLAKYHIRYRKAGRRGTLRLCAMIVQKTLVGGIRVLSGYATGGARGIRLRARGLRTLGVAAGYFQGLRGQSSTLYRTTQGH